MDQSSFDRIARLLGGVTTRRRGIGAVLATLAGGAVAASAEAKSGRKGDGKRRGGSRKPDRQGPCGDGTIEDNRCTKDSQCCTGICKMKRKGKDGAGRCRCQRRGLPCTEDRNCCKAGGQQMTCISGKCGRPKPAPTPIPTGQPCQQGVDTCADDAAECTEYETGSPAGTYCLLPNNMACTSNNVCESNLCAQETCVTSCDVCGSGCPYTTINAAITGKGAGSTINIGPGVYDTYASISDAATDNLTLRRCGARGEVRWTSTQDLYCVDVDGGYTLTLENLTFFGFNGEPGYNLLSANGNISNGAIANLTVRNCIFEFMFDGDSYGTVQLDSYTNATFTGCTFRNNFGYESGGAINCEGRNATTRNNLTLTNCTFFQNQNGDTPGAPDSYAGALYLYRSNATITGCTFQGNYGAGGGAIASEGATTATITDTLITGNFSVSSGSPYYGGGILIVPAGTTDDDAVIFNLTGSTKITRNSGNEGSGIAVLSDDPAKKWTVTGAPGRVFGNVGAPAQCAVSTDNGTSWTNVTDCAF